MSGRRGRNASHLINDECELSVKIVEIETAMCLTGHPIADKLTADQGENADSDVRLDNNRL